MFWPYLSSNRTKEINTESYNASHDRVLAPLPKLSLFIKPKPTRPLNGILLPKVTRDNLRGHVHPNPDAHGKSPYLIWDLLPRHTAFLQGCVRVLEIGTLTRALSMGMNGWYFLHWEIATEIKKAYILCPRNSTSRKVSYERTWIHAKMYIRYNSKILIWEALGCTGTWVDPINIKGLVWGASLLGWLRPERERPSCAWIWGL